jgi:hypothetical protein
VPYAESVAGIAAALATHPHHVLPAIAAIHANSPDGDPALDLAGTALDQLTLAGASDTGRAERDRHAADALGRVQELVALRACPRPGSDDAPAQEPVTAAR